MSERVDGEFEGLVRRAAAPQSDPVFRVEVLKRGEMQAFRRRTLLAGVLAVAVLAVAAIFLVLRPASLDVLAVLFFGIVVSAVFFVGAPILLRRVPLFRR